MATMNEFISNDDFMSLAAIYAEESMRRMIEHSRMIELAPQLIAAGEVTAEDAAETIEEEGKTGLLISVAGLVALKAYDQQQTIKAQAETIARLEATIAQINAGISQATALVGNTIDRIAQATNTINGMAN